MMNSYRWCVEAVPALRYPAGARVHQPAVTPQI